MAVTGRSQRGSRSVRRIVRRMVPGLGAFAVGAFVVIDVLLVSAAVTRTSPEGTGVAVPLSLPSAPPSAAAPAAAAPVPPVTPTPAATKGPAVLAPGLFLAAGSAQVAWRATAGSCTGDAARIQTTVDGGRTWSTRSTGTPDARHILTLSASSPDIGVVVADVTAACNRTALQSFTGGQFWREAAPLATTTPFVDPANPGSVQLAQGKRDAPCGDAIQVVDNGQTGAVLCGSGAVHVRSGGGDFRRIDAPGVIALAVGRDGILTAGTATPCAGTSIGRIAPASGAVSVVGCATASGAPTSGSVALSAVGDAVWLLTGDTVRVSTDGGASW